MAESTPPKKDAEISMKCYICQFYFNTKDRRPKILTCGHNVCAPCVNKLVEANTRTCPFCRLDFECEDANDLLTNMNLMKQLKKGTLSVNQNKEADVSTTKHKQLPDMFHSILTNHRIVCQETIALYSNAELSITKEINANIELSDNLVATNKHLRRLEESNTDKVNYLQEARNHLEKAQKKRAESVKRVKEIEVKSNSAEDFSSLGCLTDDLQNRSAKAKDFEDNLQKFLPVLTETRNAIEKEYQKCKENMDRIVTFTSFEEQEKEGALKNVHLDLSRELSALTECEDDLPQPITALTKCDDLPQPITADDIREMKEPLKRKIKEGKIFVRHMKKQQQQMLGQLTFTEDELLMHHMMAVESLPSDTHVVEYSEIMQIVHSSSRRTFLEFEIEDLSTVGRVFFSHSPDTELGRKFFLLCSGGMGKSYAGGNWSFEVVNKLDSVQEYFQINVIEPLMHVDLQNETKKVEYTRPWVAGTLYIGSSCLVIFTKDNPQNNLSQVFGKVYKGLDVIERLCAQSLRTSTPSRGYSTYIHVDNIACRIKDCGVVIQMP